jgi:hypothetical protein
MRVSLFGWQTMVNSRVTLHPAGHLETPESGRIHDENVFFRPDAKAFASGKFKLSLFVMQTLRSFSPVGVESP